MRNAQGGTPGNGAVSKRAAKRPVVLGQRVVNGDEIAPTMKLPPEGQAMWETVVPELMKFNAATTLDAYNLTMLCIYWADIVALREVIEQEGRYDFGSTGQARRSPVVKDFLEVAGRFEKLSAQYGLTLDSRTRLALADVTTRSIESDLNARLGVNPRRTNRISSAKKQISEGGKKQIEKE
jgi:P27 family predicted phage terminase small subunit